MERLLTRFAANAVPPAGLANLGQKSNVNTFLSSETITLGAFISPEKALASQHQANKLGGELFEEPISKFLDPDGKTLLHTTFKHWNVKRASYTFSYSDVSCRTG